jgi:hypothetical protein
MDDFELIVKHIIAQAANDGLTGSGGTGETPSQFHTISGKSRLRASGRATVRLSRCWVAPH